MATPCLVNIRCIFSVNEWTYETVTTPLDFSCALSFLDVFFLLFTVFFIRDNAVTPFQVCAEVDDAIETTGTGLCVWLSCKPVV